MQKLKKLFPLVGAILALALVSCGSDSDSDSKTAGSISYATTSVSKTTADEAFTNALTKTGDGTVTYASSKTDVAEVNATTGEVTIKGAGETTITATVADGESYTYATKTASYTLTVTAADTTPQKTAGSISYATTALEKTTADGVFTNTLTKTGNGTVSYASSKETVATVNATTGEVTIVGAGETTITATVADSDTYTYAVKTASYTLTVTQAVTALSPAFENDAIVQIKYYWQQAGYETVFNFTNNDGVYSCTCTGTAAEHGLFNGSLIKDDSSLTFSSGESSGDMEAFNFSIVFNSKDDSYKFLHKGIMFIRFSISVNGTDITSQLTEKQ